MKKKKNKKTMAYNIFIRSGPDETGYSYLFFQDGEWHLYNYQDRIEHYMTDLEIGADQNSGINLDFDSFQEASKLFVSEHETAMEAFNEVRAFWMNANGIWTGKSEALPMKEAYDDFKALDLPEVRFGVYPEGEVKNE